MTHEDATLLRRFTVEGSESAFAELVARYLDLVYSAALRQVNGDSGLAADICQSMQDYLDMLQRAPGKVAAFRLSSMADSGEDRKRVFFSTRTSDGTQFDTSFDMAYTDGTWRPVLSMRWLDGKNSSSFATSPVFGP